MMIDRKSERWRIARNIHTDRSITAYNLKEIMRQMQLDPAHTTVRDAIRHMKAKTITQIANELSLHIPAQNNRAK